MAVLPMIQVSVLLHWVKRSCVVYDEVRSVLRYWLRLDRDVQFINSYDVAEFRPA